MRMGNWESTQDLDDVYREIERLGLEKHAMELDGYGFTVVEDLMDAETVQTARQAICDICEQQTGRKPDLEKGEEHPNWRFVPYLMPRHEVFQDIMLNERGLALISYLVGKSAQLFSMGCHFKGPGEGGQIPLHADASLPPPLPAYSAVCNINYALTDYTKEGGCLAIVPGSHKLCRPPNPEESSLAGEHENPNAVPMEGPAGTAVIWHGNTWHGSYPRSIPGLRLNLAVPYARPFMKVQERYGAELPQSVIDRNSNHPRFRQLAGLEDSYGWKEEGPRFLDQVNGGYKAEFRNRMAASGHYA